MTQIKPDEVLNLCALGRIRGKVVPVFPYINRINLKQICTLLIAALAFTAQAELRQVPNVRGNTAPVYWEKTEGATATVVLLAGGDGQVKFGSDGKLRGQQSTGEKKPTAKWA